ncbi:MAG: hypothetical protein JNL24_09240 [Bacteroidia bacterium]|nr:hypothetical protein [Bacteroidia bacterium]
MISKNNSKNNKQKFNSKKTTKFKTEIMSKSNSNNFENELYQIFKKYGYLFPTTEEEVERFEKLHGSTDIQMPEKFKTPDAIIAAIKGGSGDTQEAELEKTYAMAARSGKKIPSTVLTQMRNDRSSAVDKLKKRKK